MKSHFAALGIRILDLCIYVFVLSGFLGVCVCGWGDATASLFGEYTALLLL